MRRLPSLPDLIAFEAVARYLSFTRAAEELSVTQSAISHRVRRIEKYFGAQLLQRLNPGVVLTSAGSALLPELIAALDNLARLGGRHERRLRVAAGSALCTWWLAGRLSSFMSIRPDIAIELMPIENDAGTVPEVDVRILWVNSSDAAQNATQAPLFNESVFPVCSPRLLPKGHPLRDAQALGNLKLLHKATHATGEWSWRIWCERLGIDYKTRGDELRFADLSLAISAAVNGAGVALARTFLAYDALRDGRLIVPIASIEPMPSSKSHVARWRRNRAEDPDIKAFVAWLIAESKATLAHARELI